MERYLSATLIILLLVFGSTPTWAAMSHGERAQGSGQSFQNQGIPIILIHSKQSIPSSFYKSLGVLTTDGSKSYIFVAPSALKGEVRTNLSVTVGSKDVYAIDRSAINLHQARTEKSIRKLNSEEIEFLNSSQFVIVKEVGSQVPQKQSVSKMSSMDHSLDEQSELPETYDFNYLGIKNQFVEGFACLVTLPICMAVYYYWASLALMSGIG